MTRIRVTVFLLALATTGLGAQDLFFQQALPPPPPPGMGTFVGPGPIDQVGVVALDPIAVGRPVENAPYSAEAVTEVTQVLADGNRIEQRTTATIARDSRGRTRREQQGIAVGSFVAQNPQPIVTITDPTTGVHLMLNYDRKVAFRSKPFRMKWESKEDGSGAAVVGHSVAYGAASVAIAGSAGTPAGEVHNEVHSAVTTIAVPPPGDVLFERSAFDARITTMKGQMAGEAGMREYRNEKLEPRLIEGVQAEGTKSTVTIAAGAVGNTLPIEIVSEQWYSKDLGVIVLSRRSDPRFGETVYRLTNINRNEPSPDLFQVPADFKVQDMDRGSLLPVKPHEDR
jgi:hypothetical protein